MVCGKRSPRMSAVTAGAGPSVSQKVVAVGALSCDRAGGQWETAGVTVLCLQGPLCVAVWKAAVYPWGGTVCAGSEIPRVPQGNVGSESLRVSLWAVGIVVSGASAWSFVPGSRWLPCREWAVGTSGVRVERGHGEEWESRGHAGSGSPHMSRCSVQNGVSAVST